MTAAQIIGAHVGIDLVEAGLCRLCALSTRKTLVVQHHAVYLL